MIIPCPGCKRDVDEIVQIIVEDTGMYIEVKRCRSCVDLFIGRLKQFQNARNN